jgi:hypothetical protein
MLKLLHCSVGQLEFTVGDTLLPSEMVQDQIMTLIGG